MSLVPVALRRPVTARDPHEHGRASTPLELLFDLVFVVAIASNAAQLHHGLSSAHYGTLVGYTLTWFAIWWAWMNYTWFASAYDNDDVGFRVLTFVIMTGALFLAAGVPDLFDDGQSGTVVLGYAIMRFAMVGLWLRAAAGHPEGRATALWYAGGITVVQVLWIARLGVPDGWLLPSFLLLVGGELLVPVLAEGRHGYTPFHPHHIAERYGLLTIIVLGEVILASVVAIQQVIAAGATTEGGAGHAAPFESAATSGLTWAMAPLVAGGLLIVFGLWWTYFSRDHVTVLENPRAVWLFGYGHLPIFASVAAVGAALAAGVDVVSGHAASGPRPVALALAVSISVVGLVISGLHALGDDDGPATMLPAAVVAVACLLVALLVPVDRLGRPAHGPGPHRSRRAQGAGRRTRDGGGPVSDTDEVLTEARAHVDAGRAWKARDLLAAHAETVEDPEVLTLLGHVLHGMGDLPRAGAAWFAAGAKGPEADEAVTAWREQCGDDFAAMWRSLPESVRSEPRAARVEALRAKALVADPRLDEAEGPLVRPGELEAAPDEEELRRRRRRPADRVDPRGGSSSSVP